MEIGYILTIIFACFWLGFKIYEKVQKNKAKKLKEREVYTDYE